MTRRSTLEFLRTETASGLVLALAALLALVVANSPWAPDYFELIGSPFTVAFGAFSQTLSVSEWVKDGLMAVFFFVVGMEIKFEVLKGELANPRRLALPIFAAIGGVALPALVYGGINAGAAGPFGAWATPTATDIAFALAALALVAKGLPSALRIFLLTLAIADDLIAVGLIAAFFTHAVRVWELAGAAVALGAMAALGRWRSAPFLLYAIGFLVVWGFVLKSGVNTSLAGVAAAMTVPAGPRRPGGEGVLKFFMESLHPYVAFGVLPLFAFTAAGFSVSGLSLKTLAHPVTLGVACGLFLGKQIGVFGAAALAVLTGLARKPTGASWLELYGVSILCGIGFTMSFFIGGLAFPGGDAVVQTQMRLGVIGGSLLSAAAGIGVLAYASARRASRTADQTR